MPRAHTLVLVPGLVNTGKVWRHQLAALAHVPGVRAFVAEHVPADSLAGMARSVLDRFPGPLLLAGHSMGGRIVLEACRLEPGRIRGVALLDTGCHALAAGEAGEAEVRKRRALVALSHGSGMRAMLRQWILDMLHPARYADAPLVEEIIGMMSRSSAGDFSRQVEALIARPDARGVLESLDAPALVLCGREDRWAGPPQHEAMARLARAGTLVVVPDCGHMAPLERPGEVTKALRDWLDAIPR